MTTTAAVLVAMTIPYLFLACVTLYALSTGRQDRTQLYQQSSTTTSQASTQVVEMARELVQASQKGAQSTVEVLAGAQADQAAQTQKMLETVTLTVSRIASPQPPPPLAQDIGVVQAAANQLAWDLTPDPVLVRERAELQHNGAAPPAGWASGPVNPFDHLPDDVPEPLGETAAHPGTWIDPS